MKMFILYASNAPFASHTHCFSGILALSNTSFGHFSSLSGHRFSSFGFLIPAYLSGIAPLGGVGSPHFSLFFLPPPAARKKKKGFSGTPQYCSNKNTSSIRDRKKGRKQEKE